MKTQMAEDGLHIFSLLSQGQAAEESNKKACMESLECTFAKRRWRDMQHMYSHIEAEMVAADSAMVRSTSCVAGPPPPPNKFPAKPVNPEP